MNNILIENYINGGEIKDYNVILGNKCNNYIKNIKIKYEILIDIININDLEISKENILYYNEYISEIFQIDIKKIDKKIDKLNNLEFEKYIKKILKKIDIYEDIKKPIIYCINKIQKTTINSCLSFNNNKSFIELYEILLNILDSKENQKYNKKLELKKINFPDSFEYKEKYNILILEKKELNFNNILILDNKIKNIIKKNDIISNYLNDIEIYICNLLIELNKIVQLFNKIN